MLVCFSVVLSRPRRWLLGAALALGASACLSPTLPLPPPGAPEVSAVDKDGNVTLTGTANANAVVFAFDDRTEGGAIATASSAGGYAMKLAAKTGDTIEVWQEVGGDRSASVIVTVKTK